MRGGIGGHSVGVKRKDVIFIVYNAADEPEHDSDEQSDPANVNVEDEPEEFRLQSTLSTISIHKTEEDLLKEQEWWGKNCNRKEKIELMQKEEKFVDPRTHNDREADPRSSRDSLHAGLGKEDLTLKKSVTMNLGITSSVQK